MDNRTISNYFTLLGEAVIDSEPELATIKASTARIIFLESEHEKKTNGKVIFAQCEKVANKYKWGIPCDFTITVFTPNVLGFTEEKLKVLLLHELLHVGIEPQTDGTEKYYQISKLLKANKNAKEVNDKLKSEYNDAVKGYNSIVAEVQQAIDNAVYEQQTEERYKTAYNRYIELANGDKEVAQKFFRNTYGSLEEDVIEAVLNGGEK